MLRYDVTKHLLILKARWDGFYQKHICTFYIIRHYVVNTYGGVEGQLEASLT